MQIIIKSLHNLSVVFWLGSIFFFSFFAAPSIFKVLPRNLAGDVVSDIFNKYYYVSYICGVIALITAYISINKGYIEKNSLNLLGAVLIIIMLGMSVVSGTYLRNKVADVKQEIRQTEKTSDKFEVLNKNFRKLHGISAGINILVFIFGIAVVVINTYNIRVN